MTQPTNERPDADGSGWTTQAPGTPASAPQQPVAEPTAPSGPWAHQAPSVPAATAAAPLPPAAPAAAPRREWPFAPQAPAGWAEPSGAPAERTLAPVGAPSAGPAAAPAPTAPLPPYGGYSYGRPDLGYGSDTATNPTMPLSPDARPVDVTPPPYAPDAPRGRKGGERRGPGWLALIGVSLTTAALSCAATVGLTRDDSASTATPTTQQSQSAPVVPGSSDTSPDWKTVAKAVAPSVVAVQVTTDSGGGQGSGIIYDTKGNIVTNNHVVEDANKVTVVLSDGREFDANVVGTDPSTDLAVIRISNPPSNLTAAAFGNSDAVAVGSPVMAIGNPLGLSDTVTTGIVSAVNRPVTAQSESGGGGESVTNAIQTDASINPGNSGGALLDAQGRVIGITSSIATLGSGSAFPGQGGQSGSIGLGFAIPSDEAKSVADQLIASNGKTVEHAWLGVKLKEGTVTLDGARRKAALLSEITSNGPADKAGLKSGDAVIAVNKELVAGADSLVAQVREKRAKDTVVVTIVRDGKSQDVTVTLGVRPANLG